MYLSMLTSPPLQVNGTPSYSADIDWGLTQLGGSAYATLAKKAELLTMLPSTVYSQATTAHW